jgi:type I restriction enzyme M protein
MIEVLDPQESEFICDPCCGSGGFLIKAFEYVRAKVEHEIHLAKEKIKEEYYTEQYEALSEKEKEKIDDLVTSYFTMLNSELDMNNPLSRIRELSYDCIFGTDANPRMSRTAKMNMIMHGDGHGGVHHNDGLLNVNGIFENRFDIILTNPPFGSRVEKSLKITEADKYTDEERIAKYRERFGSDVYDKAMKQVNDNIGKPLLNLFETGSMSTLTEVLFIERCLNLLKPGGRMGIVLPEGVLNNTNLQKVREFVESKAKIILITSIPQDVFIASGATVKPSLLFFKKFTEEETKQWKRIAQKAEKEIAEKYEQQKKKISDQLILKRKETLNVDEKKNLKAELKQIEDTIQNEIRSQIKKEFNYQIPIAEVEKAGISTTGAEIENELKPLALEFKKYRDENNLWTTDLKEIDYKIIDKEVKRIPIIMGVASEPEIFYSKTGK